MKETRANLSDKKKNGGVVVPHGMLLDVGATNVAVVTATVRRSVLPLVYEEGLDSSSIMEEERRD